MMEREGTAFKNDLKDPTVTQEGKQVRGKLFLEGVKTTFQSSPNWFWHRV